MASFTHPGRGPSVDTDHPLGKGAKVALAQVHAQAQLT